jgi:hypothetical protein
MEEMKETSRSPAAALATRTGIGGSGINGAQRRASSHLMGNGGA